MVSVEVKALLVAKSVPNSVKDFSRPNSFLSQFVAFILLAFSL